MLLGRARKHADYDIERLDLRALYRRFASDTKLNFVIYNGLSDANVPWNGQVRYWAQIFCPSGYEGSLGVLEGAIRLHQDTCAHTQRLKFITVNGAGQEVPTYRRGGSRHAEAICFVITICNLSQHVPYHPFPI